MKSSNTESLRKTLGDIRGYAIDIYQALSHNRSPSRAVAIAYAGAIVSKVDAALSAPLRNCDVGTASQQAQRFAELCASHSKDGARGICDDKCPFYGKEYGSDCALHWAQLPYERGIEE